MNKLPEMYHKKIEKTISNNKKVFSTLYEKVNTTYDKVKKVVGKDDTNYTVEQKIYNIFNSPNYIYKMDVVITTDEGKIKKRIVGRTKKNLITMEGEYIPINKIRDIYMAR